MEFGDVERGDVKAGRFDARACVCGNDCGENNCVGESQGVGGVWFLGIDVDPFGNRRTRRRIKPFAIGEESTAAEEGDGGLEMQAAGYRDGDDFVVVRSEDGGELADAFGIASLGEADETACG